MCSASSSPFLVLLFPPPPAPAPASDPLATLALFFHRATAAIELPPRRSWLWPSRVFEDHVEKILGRLCLSLFDLGSPPMFVASRFQRRLPPP